MMFDDEKTPETPNEDANSADGGGNLDLENMEGGAGPADATSAAESDVDGSALGAVYDVPVQVSAVLGKSEMQVNQLLKLGRGAVIELDRKVGEAIDVYVNNRLVARGEIVVVDDHLGVTMTEIVKSDKNAA